MTERSTYMKMSLKDATFIKRCGLQRVVKCWKTSRLLDTCLWKFWQFWTTNKIALKIELRYYLNCACSRRSTSIPFLIFSLFFYRGGITLTFAGRHLNNTEEAVLVVYDGGIIHTGVCITTYQTAIINYC